MSRVEQLRDASRGYARAWRDFINQHAIEPKCLYCFFEGYDDPTYYGFRINSITFGLSESLRRENIWCNGKTNLIKLHDLVSGDKRFENAWVAFFMDLDFDDPKDLPQSDNVYITPCYSIENLYLECETVAQILRDEFHLSTSDEEFDRTIELYESLLEEFNRASLELNAWIYLQRGLEKTRNSGSKMNLQDVSPSKLFNVKLSGVTQKYVVKDLDKLFSASQPIPETAIVAQITSFKNCDQTKIFRGKYLLFFLEKILKIMAEDSNKTRNREHFQKKRKVTLQLSSNVISELSQYARTPPCLTDFLIRLSEGHPQQLTLEAKN